MFKCFYNLVPDNIVNKFTLVRNTHTYDTRSAYMNGYVSPIPKLKFLNRVYYILVPLYGIQYLRISETALVYKILNFCLNVIYCNLKIIFLMCQISLLFYTSLSTL